MRSKFKWIYALLVAITMQFSFAQEKTITGTVSDNLGALPGVNVSVKGSARRVSTDFDGKYSIKAKEGEVLVFSFVEMANAEKTVGAGAVVNVSMKGATILNEVVVGALGIKKSKDAQTSSQTQIKSSELTQAANPNVIQSLTGKVSGLQISTTATGVASQTRIVLRGLRTLTGNSEALIVIDNAISSAAVLSQLPTEVVESVNVIKGQQGAALYGEQGSNGVIVITTKKGNKSGKIQVTLNSSIDFESVYKLPLRQLSYGQGWGEDPGFTDGSGIVNTHVAWENGSWGPAFNDPKFAGTLQPTGLPQADGKFLYVPYSPIENNIKSFFKTGNIFQNGVSFSLGDADSFALFTYNRQNSEFIVDGDKLLRNSFLLKAGKKIGKFNIEGSVDYTSTLTTQTTSDIYDNVLQGASNIPFERYNNGTNVNHWTAYSLSPYWRIKNVRFDDDSNIINGNVSLGYSFNKNISIIYRANIVSRNTNNTYHNNGNADEQSYAYTFDAPYQYYGSSNETYASLTGGTEFVSSSFYNSNTNRRNFYGDFLINFDYKLSKNLGLKVNLGNNIQDNYTSLVTTGGTDIDKPGIYNVNNVLNNGSVIVAGSANSLTPGQFVGVGNKLDNRVLRTRRAAAFVNADLAFKNYLFLNATARYEKSSTIKSSQFYPSVGLSFIPTKAFESLKDNSILSYAKLTTSYVVTGNSTAVNTFETYGSPGIQGTGYPFGSLNSFVRQQNVTDPNIKPEFVTTKEFGVSLGFFKDRFTLEGSFYQSDTKDLITNRTASSTSGLANLKSNVGSLQNRGFDIDFGIIPIKTANFTWSMKGSYTTFKTKVTSLADGSTESNLGVSPYNSLDIFAVVGEEFPLIKGIGFQRDPSGNVVVGGNGVPLNTPGFITLGKTTPDYILGFTNSFEYKGLKLTAVMDYRTGHQIWSETKGLGYFTGQNEDTADFDRFAPRVYPNSVQLIAGNYVTNVTPINGTYNSPGASPATANDARLTNFYSNAGFYRGNAEASIVNADAFKIREISLSYTFPQKIVSKIGIQGLRFGLNARNPFTVLAKNNRNYADPESSNAFVGNGSNNNANGVGLVETGQYPTTRTFGFSANVTF